MKIGDGYLDIISPKTAWRDYDRKELELNASVISDTTGEDERVIRVFFNGVAADDGVARVFAKLALPVGGKALPAVVLMRDTNYYVDDITTDKFTSRGYAVLIVDYTGKREDKPFYTMYPKSLSLADFTPSLLTTPPSDPRENCWIVWAKVMLRAVTYLESIEEVDASRIVAVGEGVASANVWKTCSVEESLKAGVSFFGSRFAPEYSEEDIMDEAFLSYEAALMKASYAPFLNVPMLVLGASNDRDDSIDRISEAYSLLPKTSGSRLSISERMHHALGYKQKNNFWLWLDYYLNGKGTIPVEPTLTASCSDHKLYYEIKADGGAEVELFVSQAMERSSLRNWHSETLIQTGDGEYISKQEVYDASRPIYAFVNISKDGFSVSTPLLEKLPAALGVVPTPVKASRLIYDSDMGVDDWTAYSESSHAQAKMVSGPFDIEGVSADGGSLVTYKLAEMKYKGDGSDILQVCLCSKLAQTVTLYITVKKTHLGEDRYVDYSAEIEISPEDNWQKFNLEPGDFRSEGGSCTDWTDVVSLRICSDSPIAVKSVLWV